MFFADLAGRSDDPRIAEALAEIRELCQEVLVLGKEQVGITAIEPVGQYAVKLVFDDGHDTGLYTWKYLAELGREQQQKWARYLERRAQAPRPKGSTPAK